MIKNINNEVNFITNNDDLKIIDNNQIQATSTTPPPLTCNIYKNNINIINLDIESIYCKTHKYNEYVVIEPPTTDTNGRLGRKCSICDYIQDYKSIARARPPFSICYMLYETEVTIQLAVTRTNTYYTYVTTFEEYSISNLPSGLSIDSNTGEVTGIPNFIGEKVVTVTYTNDIESISWDVSFNSIKLEDDIDISQIAFIEDPYYKDSEYTNYWDNNSRVKYSQHAKTNQNWCIGGYPAFHHYNWSFYYGFYVPYFTYVKFEDNKCEFIIPAGPYEGEVQYYTQITKTSVQNNANTFNNIKYKEYFITAEGISNSNIRYSMNCNWTLTWNIKFFVYMLNTDQLLYKSTINVHCANTAGDNTPSFIKKLYTI